MTDVLISKRARYAALKRCHGADHPATQAASRELREESLARHSRRVRREDQLAERLPSVLPELDDAATLEVTALHSIAGLLPPGGRLLRRPPFQAPHHTATVPAVS